MSDRSALENEHGSNAEQHSGLVITCGSSEYYVHRTRSCNRSKWFQRALDGGFKEGETGTVDLSEDNETTVARMVTFLYQGDYPEDENLPPYEAPSPPTAVIEANSLDDDVDWYNSKRQYPMLRTEGAVACSKMMINTAVYALADLLQMMDLKALAKWKFQNVARDYGPNYPYNGLSDNIHAVFTTTPDSDTGLRQPLIERCSQYYSSITANPKCLEAIKIYGDLSTGIISLIDDRHAKKIQDVTSAPSDLISRLYRAEDELRVQKMEKEAASENIDNAYQRLNSFLEKKLKVTEDNSWKKWLARDIGTTQKYLYKHRKNENWPWQSRNVGLEKK